MRNQTALSSDTSSDSPPNQLPPLAASAAPRPSGLTPIFNAAAKPTDSRPKLTKPLTKEDVERKIRLLQKRLSANQPVNSPTPLGNVGKTINKQQDRILSQEIKQLQRQHHAMEVWAPNSVTRQFNRSAGRSM